MISLSHKHLGTWRDGNHFIFVGRSAATGHTIMVTHNASRGPCTNFYSKGMKVAPDFKKQRNRR